MTRVAAVALVVAIATPAAAAPGPGVPNRAWSAEQRFQVVGSIQGDGAPREHGTAVMHDGYLVVPFADNVADGGIAFVDIADPTAPSIVHTLFVPDMREGHSIGFAGLLAVTQGSTGVHFWDWSDVTAPVLLSAMTLPGIEPSDYANGAWWLFWQAPYVYVAGSSRGLYVIDASDPRAPVLVSRLPTTALALPRVGALFAVGNLLVVGAGNANGLSVLDISDPVDPILLATDSSHKQYSLIVNGERAILAGTSGSRGLQVYDISDPLRLRHTGSRPLDDGTGYLTVQDDFAHLGASRLGVVKIDLADPALPVVGAGDFVEDGVDADFASVIGNLVIVGDDHGFGTRLFPHQLDPDTRPPAVNMVNPPAGAAHQAVTSRVGLTFTDQIDLRTVTADTFIVETIAGERVAGRYSGQTGVVNFAPDAALAPDTTYRIRVPAGGIRDVAGNATAVGFATTFSTGPAVRDNPCGPRWPTWSHVGDTVALSASCRGTGLRFLWNFGDGSPPTALSDSPDAAHAYAAPGHYTAILTIDGPRGRFSRSALHTVTYPRTAGRPAASSTIVHDAVGGRVWVTNPDAGTIAAIDATSLRKVAEVAVGAAPQTLTMDRAGQIWVACRDSAALSIVDAASAAVVGEVALPAGSQPHGIVATPGGEAIYVALEATGQLARIDPAARRITGLVAVGRTPRAIAVTHNGRRILVTRLISPADRGEVVEVDAATFDVRATIPLRASRGPDTGSSGRGVPNYALAIAISPDGRRAWVGSKQDNTSRGLARDGEPLTFENTVRAIVSQIELAARAEADGARIDLDNRALPSAVAFSPLGDHVYVATMASNTVDVLDAYTGQTVASIENVGKAPLGLVLDPRTDRLFVHDLLSRDVAVHHVGDLGGDNNLPRLAVIPTVDREPLPADVLRGKQIFYDAADDRMSRDNYLSCAVCHLDGGSDERVWDFSDRGEGLRNTITLRGRAGLGDGPLHWSANFDEVQDFEHDIRGAFRGKGFAADAAFATAAAEGPLGRRLAGASDDLDALAAYVASLDAIDPSPHLDADGDLTADAAAGQRLFESERVGCATCHTGPRLTDSSLDASPFRLHDVGTIGDGSGRRLGQPLAGLDTPTLVGVWATAPYLHDGSAQTLMDVITRANPGDQHGMTSQLTLAERDQLVAYLEQIGGDPAPTGGCGCAGASGSDGAAGGSGLIAIVWIAARRRRRYAPRP